MSNVIKTKQFWLQVRKEYVRGTFLCVSSDTFEDVWKYGGEEDKECIQQLGLDFLNETNTNSIFTICDMGFVLFTFYGDLYGSRRAEFFKLRTDFIQWCIDKFE